MTPMAPPPADGPSVQERYAPRLRCFGCGPMNDRGLRLKSRLTDDGAALVATFHPAPHHLAFDGVLNGGIIGALLDCHSNWMAALALMRARQAEAPPCTVTADFHVKLRHPTPMDAAVILRAWPVEIENDRAVIEATLAASDRITAACRGTFVAVKEGHPAYHRW